MNYSQNYFGKPLNDLTWNDIEGYFAEAKEETDSIEYKSFVEHGSMDSKYEGIYKAACAFLNSNGGIIIWGTPVGRRIGDKKEKSFQGALSPINIVLEKDRVISKASGNIIPMPEGINVKIIENDTDCICVFEIQKSPFSPHQTNHIYYMRLDGQSVPAPHYYVEAMFRQIKFPDIEGYVKINNITIQGHLLSYNLHLEVLILNWSPLQNETNLSFRLTTTKGVFQGYDNPASTYEYWLNGAQVIGDDLIDVLHHGAPLKTSLIIVIPAAEIMGEMRMILHFGGKNSPLKSSEYKYQLSMAAEAGHSVNPIEVERTENIFMHELPQAMSMSKEEKLRNILGR
ncbi:MAG: ATP-binding protein [Bacteroidetes bacterium]|nr:ATP-binding protein [Bacteroidota bacterium]HET6244658.1 ATP-binding protein [Bacteroidia bacterium]